MRKIFIISGCLLLSACASNTAVTLPKGQYEPVNQPGFIPKGVTKHIRAITPIAVEKDVFEQTATPSPAAQSPQQKASQTTEQHLGNVDLQTEE